jgi:Amt family ammonium transporter
VVWLVWFQRGSALGSVLQQASTQQLRCCCCWDGLGILDKILGHKLSAMGACIGTVVGLVAIPQLFGIPHAIFIGILVVL